MAGHEEAIVCSILEELALKVHELVGVRMHRLSVCEWEVKLWLDSAGIASGAWRVVVTNVTGHTCTVHVSNLLCILLRIIMSNPWNCLNLLNYLITFTTFLHF